MKRQLWFGVLGMVALLVGCSDGEATKSAGTPAIAPSPVPQTQSQQAFANSILSQPARPGRVTAIPGLLQPTNAKARLPGIQAGRRDPFAIVPGATPIVFSTKPVNPPKVNSAGSSVTVSRTPVPSVPAPVAMLPALPAAPVNASAPLPPLIVPIAPSGNGVTHSPTSLADAIAVNGVVQVAGRWSVIVKEPNASSSRYVSVGDYLENGKVLVKRIVSAGSSQPAVILQQNGVEIRKSLG